MSGNGRRLALDTNVVIDLLQARLDATASFSSFDMLCLPVPVVAELRFGVVLSPRTRNDLHRLEGFVASCAILTLDVDTAIQYADLKYKLDSAGRPIPINDLWIASVCLQHGIVLATEDKHFGFVEGLELVSFR